MFAAGLAGGTHNPMKDFEVQQPPNDSISRVAFSPVSNYLVASSWDNNVSASPPPSLPPSFLCGSPASSMLVGSLAVRYSKGGLTLQGSEEKITCLVVVRVS